jgi:hypothetical protein
LNPSKNIESIIEVVKDDGLDQLYNKKWPAIVEVATSDGSYSALSSDQFQKAPAELKETGLQTSPFLGPFKISFMLEICSVLRFENT